MCVAILMCLPRRALLAPPLEDRPRRPPPPEFVSACCGLCSEFWGFALATNVTHSATPRALREALRLRARCCDRRCKAAVGCRAWQMRGEGLAATPIRADVLLSIAAFEPVWYLRQLVENALRHSAPTTAVVLHLNCFSPLGARGRSNNRQPTTTRHAHATGGPHDLSSPSEFAVCAPSGRAAFCSRATRQ
jgi:hypothetical protein